MLRDGASQGARQTLRRRGGASAGDLQQPGIRRFVLARRGEPSCAKLKGHVEMRMSPD